MLGLSPAAIAWQHTTKHTCRAALAPLFVAQPERDAWQTATTSKQTGVPLATQTSCTSHMHRRLTVWASLTCTRT